MSYFNPVTAFGKLINRRKQSTAEEESSSDGKGYPVQESWEMQVSPEEAVSSIWVIRYDELNRRHFWFNIQTGQCTYDLKKPTTMVLPQSAAPGVLAVPVAHAAPAAPVAYGAPAAPVAYGAPAAPVAHGAPAAPVAYGAPAAPVAHGAPAAPSAPVAHGAPAAPSAPVAPFVYPPEIMPHLLVSPRTATAMMHGQQQAFWDPMLAMPEPGQDPQSR